MIDMVSITIRLDRTLKDKIVEAASSEGINISEFVRRACMERLKRREAETKYLRFSKDIVVDLLCKGFDPIALRQMGYSKDVIKEAFEEVKELAEMSEELQRFSSLREKMKMQAEICRHCKLLNYSLALLELEMLDRKALEYSLFVCIKTFGKLPLPEILSKGDELAQYLKLAIFLVSFVREMEGKFFDENVSPDEFIKKELGVQFAALWNSLENPENIIKSLIEHEKKKQSKND